jgi:16S rRNA (cytosine1402-N4)-methyltransferase
MAHTSVLLEESVEGLNLVPGITVLDGTLGEGGHSEAIARKLGGVVRIIGLDVDSAAISIARSKLEATGAKLDLIQANFRDLARVLDDLGVPAVDRILLDLGVRSGHFEDSGRGFSVRRDEPLSMTLGDTGSLTGFTAYDVVNDWEEKNMATIIESYGEERFARQIARAIAAYRESGEIKTSGQLAAIVAEALPARYRHSKIHPATKTFQAIRIAVNDELGALRDGLEGGLLRLASGGRMAVIAFHSLEDRIVKDCFRMAKASGKGVPVTKRPLMPTDEEQRMNPRSRSAKLRIFEKSKQ